MQNFFGCGLDFLLSPLSHHLPCDHKMKQVTRRLDFCTGLFCRTEWLRARTPRFEFLLYFLASSSKSLNFSAFIFSWGCWKDLKIKYNTRKTTLETVPGTKQASNHQSYSKSTVLPGTGHIRGGSWELILIAGVV